MIEQQHHILFNRDVVTQIVPQWFSIEYWRGQAEVTAASTGRGSAWFIESAEVTPGVLASCDTCPLSMVLRHYRRGGAMAGLLGDKYLWRGMEKTRAWCEWKLLAGLYQQGLPVPEPIAAHVIRNGIFYRADLLTRKISNAQSLSQCLEEQPLDPVIWHAIGKLVRRFHNARVYHADLNAHNILLDQQKKLYVIDFDKGKIMSAAQDNRYWQQANLQRLQRSLIKLCKQTAGFHFTPRDWQALEEGYRKG